MKKVFNYLLIVLALGICLMGLQVNVEATQPQPKTTSASEPKYIMNEKGKDIFIANGTPITIIKKNDGKTYATWGSNSEQLLTDETTVVGGAYNPYSSGNEKKSIEYDSTSITMNSGKVGNIVGGNAIDANYDKYEKIHVGTINVNINGGEVKEIYGVSSALPSISNTALGVDYYSKMSNYYYADKVNMTIKNANITDRICILTSYTYANEAIVNISNSKFNGDVDSGLLVGTNGKVNKFTANIADSSLVNISAGLRTMVNNMTVNISGKSVIGDIYAGSHYPEVEHSDAWITGNWSMGSVNYGQVGSMLFNIGEDVKYNNIYAGFQYIDKTVFNNTYANNTNKNIVAKGIENSERSNLVINVASAPFVTNCKLKSMMNFNKDFVTVNYKKDAEVVVTNPNDKVEVPTIGIIDKGNVETILTKILATNKQILSYIKQGITVDVKVDSKVVTKPSKEIVNKIQSLDKDAKIASYFEILINIMNTETNEKLDDISEIDSQMNLSVILPDKLKEVAKGYKRTYYILREHNGQIEVLNSKLSTDGKYVAFSSDKFSTFALAYSDTPITVKNPNTLDGGIMNNLVIITASLLLAIGSAMYLRKELKTSRKI